MLDIDTLVATPRGNNTRRVGRAAMIAAVLVSALAGTATTANAAVGSDHLNRNETLSANQSISSRSGQYVLVQQSDGNLVEYRDGRALWASNSGGQAGARTVMQGDGNLVVYAGSGRAAFATGTAGTAADTLLVQDDGNVVLYGGGRAWWASRDGLLAAPAVFSGNPAAWIGSPARATWPNQEGCSGAAYPSDACSLPSVHHVVYGPASDPNTDWAADLQNVGVGTPVRLFAAPQGQGAVSTKVEIVGPACASRNVADGGYRVTVGIYSGGSRIGTVTYAHIDPLVTQGAWVERWGTTVGTVGNYRAGGCWTAPHIHVEMRSEKKYACYNRGWQPGQQMEATNFVGFVGGNYASGVRQACP